jgi:hypothetical protein
MVLKGNRQSFSHLSVARIVSAVGLALMLLAASAQAKGPDQLGARDDWDALPCLMQSIPEPQGGVGVGQFGDIEGDVAVCGNCVFRFDGAEWQLETLLPSCGDALSGPVIADGRPGDDQMGENAGAVYIYRYDGAEWVLEAELFASDAEPFDQFGFSVDVDGDVMVVGADEYKVYADRPGSAYVFRRVGEYWIEEAKLMASDGQVDDRFGYDVAIEGDHIIVGTPRNAVYCFQREDNFWTEVQKLTPPDGPSYMKFGKSIARDGEYAVVGAPGDDELGFSSGSAFVYLRVDEGWQLRQQLLASDGGEQEEFGSAVAVSGGTILVGADAPYISEWAYVFRQTSGTWLEVVKFDGFTEFLAMNQDRALIGHPYDNDGMAYFYAGLVGADCNNNGTADGCDIFLGTSEDLNDNGIPDECECPADFDGDGDVDTADLLFLLGAWGTPDGDVDFDGDTDTSDLLALLAAWGECPQ